jgi:hypothetical protein
MADLTASNFDLAPPQRGAVEPRPTQTVLGGIFDGVASLTKGMENKLYNDRLDQEQDKLKGLNDLSVGLFKTDQAANNVPQAATDAVATLDKTKAGVDQGVLPSTAYSTQLQNLTSQVMAAHPDSAYNIMDYMRTSGHESSMFPQLAAQRAQQEGAQASVIKGQQDAYDYYIKAGGLPGTDFARGASAGQQLLQAEYQAKAAAAAAQAAREGLTTDIEGAKVQDAQANKLGLQSVQTEIGARLGPIADTFNDLMVNVPPDQFEKVSQGLIAQIDVMANSAKRSAVDHLTKIGIGSNENIDNVYKQVDTIAAGMKAVYSDKTGESQRTLKVMEDKFKLSFAQAAPLYWQISQEIGSNQAAALFGNQSLLDPKISKAIADELNGFSAGTPTGQMAVHDIVSILKGDTSLHDYDPQKAASYMGAIVTGKNASERAILSGNGTSVDSHTYTTTLGNVINAAHSLNPASGTNDLYNATSLVATQGSRVAIDKLVADPLTREQGEALGLQSHLTAIKLLQDFNQNKVGPNKFQSVVYDPQAGVFKIKFDRDAFNRDKSLNKPYDPRGTSVMLRMFSRVSDSAQKKVASMNALLDHAVKTSKYDQGLPKGANPIDLRNSFATNTPVQAKDAKGKPIVDSKTQWVEAEQRLEDTMRRFPLTVQAQDAGWDPLTSAVAHVESNGNPNAVSPKGAKGTMQVMPKTNLDPGFGVTPAKDDSEAERVRVGQDYLRALKGKYGNESFALAAFNWGPGNVDKWIKGGAHWSDLPAETRDYISKVIVTRDGMGAK